MGLVNQNVDFEKLIRSGKKKKLTSLGNTTTSRQRLARTTNYLIGLDDGGSGAMSRHSSPLLRNVREVARCHGTPLPSGQATIPALAGEAQGSPTEVYQTCSFYGTARCPAMAGL